MKHASITGITGQGGSYLAEFLLETWYEVHGIVRGSAIKDPDYRMSRIRNIRNILPQVIIHGGLVESFASVFNVVKEVEPEECYHLAAQSYVAYPFEDEFSTLMTNINGTHHTLSAVKQIAPSCRFYFVASSEMFGNVEPPQNENTAFRPRSCYGISKLAGYHLERNYREAYNLFAVNGMLFNHESPRRGFEFVTRKITSGVAKIKMGMTNELRLGNLNAKRDWGHSKDYVKAMLMMLQMDSPEDYVIGSGESHSVKEFAQIAFNYVGLDYKEFVIEDPQYYRPAEIYDLVADASKAKTKFGWKCQYTFIDFVREMVGSDLQSVSKN